MQEQDTANVETSSQYDFLGSIMRGDYWIWGIYIFLFCISVVEIFSATSQLTFRGGYASDPAVRHVTFLLAGVVAWIFLLIKEKKPYNPFARSEGSKGVAALCEEFGQVFYVYAMARKPLLAAPMVASYCIVSVILGRVFLKEKLKPGQVACVIAVIIGIVLLGISDGLAEA